jgi:mRNA interferase RelE/StbE
MWKLEFSKSAEKDILKLNQTVQQEVMKYFKKVVASDNPTLFGKALTGDKKGLWRYRIGDYRAICEIHNDELKIVAINIDHRRKVYD